jgi:hypothetical protein
MKIEEDPRGKITNSLTRRQLIRLGTGAVLMSQGESVGSKILFGGNGPRKSGRSVKIRPLTSLETPVVCCQSIGFELPELPGEEFRIVIPELISDTKEPILPWEQPPPNWDIRENLARCLIEIHNTIRMEAEVRFCDERIEARVMVTNLSQRSWEMVNAFTCFAFYAAPSFNDPQLTRTYFPVNGQWKSVAELFREHDPGTGPYTFFPVAGGPPLDDLWLCRKIPQRCPQVVSNGCGYVVSTGGDWIAGMTTRTPAYVFHNRREPCIHVDPLMGTVAAGATAEGISNIYIFRGTVASFMKRCQQKEDPN